MKNQVIKCLTPEHGKQIIQYWKDQGIDTGNYEGSNCESEGKKYIYYGTINGWFSNHSIGSVEENNAEIIELPKVIDYTIPGTPLPKFKDGKRYEYRCDFWPDSDPLNRVFLDFLNRYNLISLGSKEFKGETYILFDYNNVISKHCYMMKLSDPFFQTTLPQPVFVLPDKWYIKGCPELMEFCCEKIDGKKRANIMGGYSNYYYWKEGNCPDSSLWYERWSCELACSTLEDYTEITLEQYKSTLKNIKMEKFSKKINAKQAQQIIDMACAGWKSKLAKLWAESIVLGKDITITDEGAYKEGRQACDASQNRILDEIFGKDEPEFNASMLEIGEVMVVTETNSYKDAFLLRTYDNIVNLYDANQVWAKTCTLVGRKVKLNPITYTEI